MPTRSGIATVAVERVQPGTRQADTDRLAVEEPLELRLEHRTDGGWQRTSAAVTMRTPGHDVDLALGFLFTEGIVRQYADVDTFRHSGPAGATPGTRNVLTVRLQPGVAFDAARLERHFYTTSSCGVCGKTSLDALEVAGCTPVVPGPPVDPDVIYALPDTLRQSQALFEQTGGLHAAALFDAAGTLLSVREDVGRHNAVDKLVGQAVMAEQTPLTGRILLVSGRASFELTQKAAVAGLPVLAAVGAPSSLAVACAERFGLTLLGFVRGRRFNVYSGADRLQPVSSTIAVKP